MANVVFMGTPDFAVPTLERLIATQRVVGVVTQPDRPAGRGRQPQPSPVKKVARAAGLPIYQPQSLRQEEAAAPIRAWRPEVIVVAAFGQILRPHLLDLPPHGCINVHASLLPRWRGASPIQHAIMAGDTETGITLMQMDPGLDTGPMYVRAAIPIRPDETAVSLHDRLAQLGAKMVGRHLDAILSGALTPTPQDDSQATYAPMIKKEAGALDWTLPAEVLERQIRALTPWPGAFTTWEGTNLKILRATPVNGRLPQDQPGKVITQQDNVVALTGHGGLRLEQVQLAGKQAMEVADFVNGRPHFIGSTLGDGQHP